MQNYNNPDTNVFLWRKRIQWDDRSSEALIRTGFVQIKPWLLIAVHTSFLALLTEDSPKSTHGHFSLVHLICVCSFSGYLFYIAIGEKIIIKTCPCLLLF